MLSPEQQALTEDFGVQYRHLENPLMRTLGRNACGCDYAGTSWTTRDEADRICELLELKPSRRLLEVGAGSGWPGLYLARHSGCDLTLVDLPLPGLQIAAQRVVDDRLAGCCWIVVADGAALPFAGHPFDAISHSDVLCCLDAKLEVLRACRRVTQQNGTMVFTVISIVSGMSSADRHRAIELGPPFVEAALEYATMLEQTGWRIVDRVDLTADYAVTARRYLHEQETHLDGLGVLLGPEELDAQLIRMRAKVTAIEEGIFLRELYRAIPKGSI